MNNEKNDSTISHDEQNNPNQNTQNTQNTQTKQPIQKIQKPMQYSKINSEMDWLNEDQVANGIKYEVSKYPQNKIILFENLEPRMLMNAVEILGNLFGQKQIIEIDNWLRETYNLNAIQRRDIIYNEHSKPSNIKLLKESSIRKIADGSKSKLTKLSNKIIECLSSKRLFIIPIWKAHHFSVVIGFRDNLVHYDSGSHFSDHYTSVTEIVEFFNIVNDSHTTQTNYRHKITIQKGQCTKQKGSVECGYFTSLNVSLLIPQFLAENTNEIPKSIFNQDDSSTVEYINQLVNLPK